MKKNKLKLTCQAVKQPRGTLSLKTRLKAGIVGGAVKKMGGLEGIGL